MRQTWRWFGPNDNVSINDMRQAGVEGVVSALHHIPNGQIWTIDEIKKRQNEISQTTDGNPTGLIWEVVESLPVSEEIKRQSGEWRSHIENYKTSLQNLAQCDIKVICYNFMPILDWTRTELSHQLPNGAKCMRFDIIDFAAFDLCLLKRKIKPSEYSEQIIEQARKRYEAMSARHKTELVDNILCGLPGAEQGFTLDNLTEHLADYAKISDQLLRQHQYDFLGEIIQIAEENGVRMCCHPDDPPFPLLGLPRIMSTEDDYKQLTDTINSPANGITLCSGSMGVRSDNDLAGMMKRLGDKVHFLHLRNVTRESNGDKISFHEASHLEGATDMVTLIKAILNEEKRRRDLGRTDCSIPFRPDHGQDILNDLDTNTQPGYPAIGRLKGLAELRGIMTALTHPDITP